MRTVISALSVAKETLASHHAMKEMVTMLACLQICAQKVAKLQRPTWTGIYEASRGDLALVSTAGSLVLTVYHRVLIQSLGDSQVETSLPA